MIESFRHKGLSQLYHQDLSKGVPAALVTKISEILGALDIASHPEQLSFPGWRLHPLKGDLKGFWSITVSGNWRIIFRFSGSNVTDVDFVDYY